MAARLEISHSASWKASVRQYRAYPIDWLWRRRSSSAFAIGEIASVLSNRKKQGARSEYDHSQAGPTVTATAK
jgi:hypothetical protein